MKRPRALKRLHDVLEDHVNRWAWQVIEAGSYLDNRKRGATWALAEDSWGDLRVPSIRGRLQHGEPWWRAHFEPLNPIHLAAYLWSRHLGGLAAVDV